MKCRKQKSWLAYFKENAKKERVNWEVVPQMSDFERRTLIPSMKAWQLGETSEGKSLLAAARKYAQNIKEPEYIDAIELFIKEEQKHGANLGKYLDIIGEYRLSFDVGDYLFRKIRGWNKNIEIWTITVIIVECYAQLYYKALSDATDCPLLKMICKDILIDEAPHIRFQLDRLTTIVQRSKRIWLLPKKALYYSLYLGITWAIWFSHSSVFKVAGYTRGLYIRRSRQGFKKIYCVLFNSRSSVPFYHRKTKMKNQVPFQELEGQTN